MLLRNYLNNGVKEVCYGDPVWDLLDQKRYRFAGKTEDGFVELMENDSNKILPDLRHPEQVKAI